MKLSQYRRLYKEALIENLREQQIEDLIAEIADRYTINDWKRFEKELEAQDHDGESS